MPRNQQRSQLSVAYSTTLRKGGEVTTSETEFDGIWGVLRGRSCQSKARSGATVARFAANPVIAVAQQLRVSSRMSLTTSRGGGVWFRLALIFRCDLTETAWLGGRV